MILVSRDEILSRSVDGIPAVLKIIHKLYLSIIYKKFHPRKTKSLLYCWDSSFPGRNFPM